MHRSRYVRPVEKWDTSQTHHACLYPMPWVPDTTDKSNKHLSPHEPLLRPIFPPCTSYRCIHTDVRYILQRHCSRIVIRHMHAWSTYRITGSRSQTEVRTCFLLALLLYLPISKDSDANQITVQNFIYFPDTYVYGVQEYRISCMVFLIIFFVRGRTRCSKVMSIPSTPRFYISPIWGKVQREQKERILRRQLATFLFISFYFI